MDHNICIMTESDFRDEHSVFGEEDNNPFPHTARLASRIQSQRSGNAEIAEIRGDNHIKGSLNDAGGQRNGPNGGSYTENNEYGENDESQGNGTNDDADESLLLYKGDREPYNTVYINYENRVTKLLRPETNAYIQISEAGKSNEGMANSLKKYIVYTIKLINGDDSKEEIHTRRRYSDFESLRDELTKVFPLVIIPPIPPKNYLTLNVLNGLVGSSSSTAASSSGNGSTAAESASHNGLSGATYSYINSNHLNKNRLIEHRKRLLSNFLNNCLHIPQIRNLEFFAKFLDPSANWSDEISLINSQLPKSVYQLNPENGLRTSPLYVNLPLPVSSNPLSIPFLKPLNAKKITKTTNKLLGTANSADQVSPEAEANAPENVNGSLVEANQNQVVRTSHLDDINKKIMDNFIGLSCDYVELGTVLNSFSLMWTDSLKVKIGKHPELDDVKLDVIFDKIGVAFDRSYITINALIGELETKFSEPLGEAVQYSSILQLVKKFQDRKLKQKDLLDAEVKDKRKELGELMKADFEATKIENAINSQVLRGPSNGEVQAPPSSSSKSSSKMRLFPNMSSLKKITKYVSDIMDQNPDLTRKQRVSQLQTKISILEQCQNIMLEDISYITDELDKNFKAFRQQEFKSIYQILLSYNGIMISWAKKNIEIWEEIKEEIEAFGS